MRCCVGYSERAAFAERNSCCITRSRGSQKHFKGATQRLLATVALSLPLGLLVTAVTCAAALWHDRNPDHRSAILLQGEARFAAYHTPATACTPWNCQARIASAKMPAAAKLKELPKSIIIAAESICICTLCCRPGSHG